MDIKSFFTTTISRPTKFFLAKVHNVYQTACKEGQKQRLAQTVYYSMTTLAYLQHYVDYFNDFIPFINFYSRKDIILDDPEPDCFAIKEGNVLAVPGYVMDRPIVQNKSSFDQTPSLLKITPSTELASACLKSSAFSGGLVDVLELLQLFQKQINEKLACLTLADLMPYFNYIVEENFHIPLHTFTLSVDMFDDEDETQHVTFEQNDKIFYLE
ncbi:MAG: hypothetical protein EOP45_17215 [Sphingobacteriaceae bacterium]|nr:MAG: hypothetical protein EOP45_17215 [Sphingobacteriaceae bacterium]